MLPLLALALPGRARPSSTGATTRSAPTGPEHAEIDVDFFLHGDLGRAAAWGERAQPGDTVGFAGPRLHWKGVDGFDWSLLVADETGLPALLAILETLPAGHRAIAIAGAEEPQDIETRADVDLRWMPADGHRRRGARARAARRPRRRLGRRALAGMTKIRRHVRAQRRFARGAVQVLGYW